jgi:hypothetical protein
MKVCTIAKDGLPDMDKLVGRVAFIFDGSIVSGWPLEKVDGEDHVLWEADDDVGRNGVFNGVKKYVVFDKPVWDL